MGDGQDGYLVRSAREDRMLRASERSEARAREVEKRRRALDRAFEGHKHLSTLSATALVLIFAADRLDAAAVDVLLGMVAFGLSLILSLMGLSTTVYAEQANSTPSKRTERLAGTWRTSPLGS